MLQWRYNMKLRFNFKLLKTNFVKNCQIVISNKNIIAKTEEGVLGPKINALNDISERKQSKK